MMSKKQPLNNFSGLVFSTNPDAMVPQEAVHVETPANHQQKLRVILDKKQRKGKIVTLVENFVGNEDDLAHLGKTLKTKCGTGGNTKDGIIIIQGDFKDKIIAWLREMGYTQTK